MYFLLYSTYLLRVTLLPVLKDSFLIRIAIVWDKECDHLTYDFCVLCIPLIHTQASFSASLSLPPECWDSRQVHRIQLLGVLTVC